MSVSSVDRPVTPLRQRMLEDMAMRGLRQETQRNYLRSVRDFAAFLERPPDTATPEDIRRYQVHQAESGVQPQSVNCSVSALRFFFSVTVARPDLSRRLVVVRYPQKLPTVLNVEEVGRLLEMAPGPKYRAALGTAYGAGLRVSEVAHLKVGDMACRAVFQVDQAASAHQTILRRVGKRGEDADLDRGVGLRAHRDRQGAARAGSAAHIAAGLFSITIFEKMPIKSAILASADDTEESESNKQLNLLTF